MGGQDGNRGYYFQAVVSILDACTNEEWEKISVEYTTSDDKVDIALLNDSNGVTRATQVKSSINQFSVANIVKWLKELTNDVVAERYELILIGNCNKSANTFIKSIEKYYANKMDEESKKSLSGYTELLDGKIITVLVLPFNADHLYGIIRDRLNKFLSSLSYTVNYTVLDELAHALVSLQMLFATKGQYISRVNYIDNIKKWVEVSSNGQLLKPFSNTSLSIKAFDFSSMSVCDDFTPVRIIESPSFLAIRNKYLIRGSDLISKISEIIIESPKTNTSIDENTNKVNPEHLKKYIDDLSVIEKLSKAPFLTQETSVSAELSEKEKNEAKESIEKYWDITVDDNFFCVGGLTKNTSFSKLYGSGTSFSGTDIEKNKNASIQLLMETILNLDILGFFSNLFSQLYYIPLCINNNGKESDTNITVTINILNSSISPFVFKNDFSSNDYEFLEVISDWFVEEDIISKVFDASDNGVVKENFSTNNLPHGIPLSLPNFNGKRKTYGIEDFMIRFFDFQAKPDMYGNISYNISSLRVAESKWLSPFLFFIPKGSGSGIKYSILSENSNEKTEGIIEWNWPQFE